MNRVGVIVARFQTPYLHTGHRHIIDRAYKDNDRVLVVLGYTGGQADRHDPMDIIVRSKFLEAEYPDMLVLSQRDLPDDAVWTADLDDLLDWALPESTVTLYGARDSFIPHYSGKYKVVEVDSPPSVSATELRASVGTLASEDFRRGVIWAANRRKPTSYQAVDIAIIKDDRPWGEDTEPMVFLGKKHGEDGLLFPGGFVDPKDESLEMAAKREAYEETGGMGVDNHFHYLGSYRIDADWRYRRSDDKVMSAFFVTHHMFGPAQASDDLKDGDWYPISALPGILSTTHKKLGERLVQYATGRYHGLRAKKKKEEAQT